MGIVKNYTRIGGLQVYSSTDLHIMLSMEFTNITKTKDRICAIFMTILSSVTKYMIF